MSTQPPQQLQDYAFSLNPAATMLVQTRPNPTKQLMDDLHILFAKFDMDAEASNFLGGVNDLLRGTWFAEVPADVLIAMALHGQQIRPQKRDAMSEQIKPIRPGVRYVVSGFHQNV
ncbi:hypothetical protein IFM61392_05076 [Aspergillus lentulus]|uniref:Uncharacterized protein n=1 Tax=Aspergillus lentulus TaxID=293939 RepID=A0AAN6BRP5_ASPLE|nr:hypothetical protein CNMCM8060_008775 [Aspergillus lentulus]KAF4191960.1 hypothetical protein CNMCM8694_001085 [Aspergillus lentulus]KAF4206303.1 hypothetical protein CNMCM8927_005251 [Aspergillus lentulus]GFF64481.1 hypothetical protein IFM60648_01279 [Aspergillus lentulus]GFF68557.1 hypothetical protein IFM62136_07315 [Aspergillus lentulus]